MKMFFRDVRATKRRALLMDLNSIARKEIGKALDERVKPTLVKSHEIIVKNWKHKPGFSTDEWFRPDKIHVYVFPTGPHRDIWVYVDQGTEPHPITPKRVPWLKFKAGTYVPKTLARPARTVAGGGYVQNPQWVTTKEVSHPGSEAREFSKQIAEDILPDFRREMENAFRRTADKVSE